MGLHRFSGRIVLLLAFVPCSPSGARAQDAVATVHGRAIDRDGKPVAGCAVGLFDLGQCFDTKELLASPLATTDAEGRYTIEAKQSHYYVVAVATKGHQVCVQRLQGEAGAVRYVPDALMLPGATLLGRVRDAAGKPIVGARVRVEDPLVADTFVMTWFESMARSDAQGIFAVPGVPRTGLRVTASAPGFPAVVRLAAHDSPLDFTLTWTGLVRGRVLDADGKAMQSVGVNAVTAEQQDGAERIVSDAEGHFALTVPRAQRFRVAAYEGKAPYRQFSSGLLHGPAEDIVLSPAQAVAPDARTVTLRCVDAASKAPIADFCASWFAIDPKSSVVALMRHPETRKPYRDEAVFDVQPDYGDKTFGTIVVDARGHGFAIVPIPDDVAQPLVAELPAECSVSGCVLDAETGKPAVGAAVRALPHTNLSGGGPDPWKVGAITDANGLYRVGGLAPGNYDLQVYGVGRPASRSVQVTLDHDKPGTMDLEVPKARFLAVELVGDIPANCLGTITWGGGYSSGAGDGVMLQAMLPSPPTVPVAGPRMHKLGPVGNGQFRAKLLLPTRDRLGSCLTIDLGEIADAGTRLELPDLRQVVHTGRVHLPSDVPPERVAVVAQRIAGRRRNDPFADIGLRTPFAVCLGSDGSFVIDLAPGEYALQLADLETGLIFHTEEQNLVVDAVSAAKPIEITPTIRWLDITFEPTVPDAPVVCTIVSIDATRPRAGELAGMLRHGSGSNKREQGYWPFRAGTTHVRWLVATGNLQLQAQQTFQMLARGSNGYRAEPVDRAELDITEPLHRVTFRIPPPPSDAELERPAAK
ncbi:MAG TPA: carboxypeptidase-like regulatory domain-containing protein [Planctomycetota bacterium]|nr:carboxypeptidase-like regulatory domain-containing protein [Planctomycetota bacterium]